MRKYLALFVVIFGLAVYVSVQDERATQQSIQTSAQLANGTASAKAGEKQPQENRPDTGRFKRICFSFFRWPNGTTAWAIIFTLLAIAEQTQHTAKAARATQASTDAIEKQTRVLSRQNRNMVAKERAWISMKFPDGSESMTVRTDQKVMLGSFRINIENIGGTAASNIVVEYDTFASDSDTALPSKEMYYAASAGTIQHGTWEETAPLLIDPRFSGKEVPLTFYVYLRVRVTYNDVFHKKLNTSKFLSRREFMCTRPGEAVSNVFWEGCGGAVDNEST